MAVGQLLTLTGSLTVAPVGAPPGFAPLPILLGASLGLALKHLDEILLDDDDPHPISFGGLDAAQVLFIQVLGGTVTATLTTLDGAAQVVPISEVFLLISKDTPVTALDLTRHPGIENTVTVSLFLGQVPS